MAAPPKTDPAARIEVAWDLVDEAIAKGTLTLSDGTVRVIDTRHLVNLIRWLASQNLQKKKSSLRVPEAFAKLV